MTGGAGFVGSSLAVALRRRSGTPDVVVLDNLRRRGSELNLGRLRDAGATFVHGDVRSRSDLEALDGTFDVVIDASAEPSVHAGMTGSPRYTLETSIAGTINLLELTRRRGGVFVFLSSSRVYSIAPLRALAITEGPTRFDLADRQPVAGAEPGGISECFPTDLPRSFYGAGKLASELIVQEYGDAYGLDTVINRCGVIAGPGQFGTPEQGVFTLWVARHVLGQPLTYIGFGGEGKQVRDLMHPDDLFALIELQLDAIARVRGEVFNAGGGLEGSVSLRELTELCREAAGREVPVAADARTAAVNIPVYISNNAKVGEAPGWRPTPLAAGDRGRHRDGCAGTGASSSRCSDGD